jgi:hypothetical protein
MEYFCGYILFTFYIFCWNSLDTASFIYLVYLFLVYLMMQSVAQMMGWLINLWLIENDVEGSGCGLLLR